MAAWGQIAMAPLFSRASGAVSRYLTDYQSIRRRFGLRWWLEILVIAVFYSFYALIRNYFGSGRVGWEVAFENAEAVIEIERFFGLYQELRIQEWFIDWEIFIRFWNMFYGLFHFAVTGIVLIWLYVRYPADFARWRTIGLITTGLGLVGYALFPLMPPRLLGASIAEYGAGMPDIYTYVDTVKEFGGLWRYDSGAFQNVSNQYAAMPSLHFAWASWCTAVLYPRMRYGLTKTLVVLYPFATLFSIVVTANHFWLDAAGGVGALLIGYFLGTYLHRRWAKLREKPPLTNLTRNQPAVTANSSVGAKISSGMSQAIAEPGRARAVSTLSSQANSISGKRLCLASGSSGYLLDTG